MGFISKAVGGNNDYQGQQANISGPDLSSFQLGDNGNNAADVFNQQTLANSLFNAANGNGPSAAGIQMQQGLNQAQNETQSAIRSQKGINPALASKMANEAGGNLSANAIGNAGVLKAQEQQGARGQLAQALATQRGQDISQQQTANQGAAARANALNQANQIQVQNTLGAEGISAGAAAQNAGTNAGIAGGVIGGLGSMLSLSKGGQVPFVPHMSDGGDPMSYINEILSMGDRGAKSGAAVGKGLTAGLTNNPAQGEKNSLFGKPTNSNSIGDAGGEAGGGGGMLDSLGGVEGGSAVDSAAGEGGGSALGLLALAAKGGKVGGKAKVPGDSPENDVVPAVLSPGEVVVPRSKSQDPEMAKEFIEHLQSRHRRKSEPIGYGKVLEAQQDLHHRISHLEKLACGGYAGR